MTSADPTIKNYYENPDQYLADHQNFFATHNPKTDVDYLINVLAITKSDQILDIACGQGRHTTELARRGYHVSGVDFSADLISKAVTAAKASDLKIKYFIQNLEELKPPNTFDVIYWFFSDFAHIDLSKVMHNISNNLNPGGRLLIDADNHYRIKKYLKFHQKSSLQFDDDKKILIDQKKSTIVPYPDEFAWRTMMNENKLTITTLHGNHNKSPYSAETQRLIVIAKKDL